MTLDELSAEYKASAEPLRKRLRELRELLKSETDPDKIWHLKHRISLLTPMLTQMNDLAELTHRYYDHSHYASDKYSTVNMVASDTSRKDRITAQINDTVGMPPQLAEEADWEPSDITHRSKRPKNKKEN